MSLMERSERKVGTQLKRQAMILGMFVLAFWILESLDWLLFRGALDSLGIRPRSAAGLWGILVAPFLHAGFRHLVANTIPFLVLGWFVMLGSIRNFIAVTLITLLVSGLGIWLIGASRSIHLGASGLIFGYFGFLVLRAYFERSLASILWSILVVFLYGGMVWGIVPREAGVSWQAHLFGFLGGGLSAYLLANRSHTLETL